MHILWAEYLILMESHLFNINLYNTYWIHLGCTSARRRSNSRIFSPEISQTLSRGMVQKPSPETVQKLSHDIVRNIWPDIARKLSHDIAQNIWPDLARNLSRDNTFKFGMWATMIKGNNPTDFQPCRSNPKFKDRSQKPPLKTLNDPIHDPKWIHSWP